MNDNEVKVYYGEPPSGATGGWPCAYMLLYESEELLKGFYSNNVDQQTVNGGRRQ